ncbi:MAG: sigma-70 family RNA polymerase sigma factor [Saprospiraceae bacterium]|nr:sigma-70 family RNA polymerase sigma factor [Saprospiraceae bacterium]
MNSEPTICLQYIVDHYYDQLLAFTIAICAKYGIYQREDAESVLQDIMIKIHRNLGKINAQPEDKRLNYIFSMIKNHLIDLLRRSNKIDYNSDVITDYNELLSNEDHLYTVNKDLIEKILSDLTDFEASCIVLHAEGYSQKEIAVQLDSKPSTVGVTIYRLRKKIIAKYGGQYRDE